VDRYRKLLETIRQTTTDAKIFKVEEGKIVSVR